MKKMYFVFSLLLMILGINTAKAGVTLGTQVTDPSTLQAGSKIIMYANHVQNAEQQTHKFLASLGDSLLYVETGTETIDPYTVFEMVAAEGKTVNGKPAFYLKNDYNQKFIAYKFVAGDLNEGGSVGSNGDEIEMLMYFTADQTKATPIAIMTQADGAKWMKYDATTPDVENTMMVMAQCPEVDNKAIALNINLAGVGIANYADWAAWWQVYTANITENYVDDLTALYTKVESIIFKGGTAPGCYDAALVDAYNAAKAKAGELLNGSGEVTNEAAKEAYKALESAYLALITGKEVPVTENYYRIVSALAAFGEQQDGAVKTMYATNDGKMRWMNLDEEDATMVWKAIDRKDGSFLMYNIGTGQYMATSKAPGTSQQYVMSNDSTNNGVKFVSVGQSAFNLKPSVNNSGAMHADGHGGGSGKEGNIVAWNGGLGTASVWYIQNVAAEQIPGFEAIGQQNMLNRALTDLYTAAKAKYDIGSSFSIDKENWLVTADDLAADANVITSNQDHNSLASEPDGAGFPGLLDNDTTSYWHAYWGEGHLPSGEGYLQFKFNKPVDAFSFFMQRRKVDGGSNAQPTSLRFLASNDTTNAEGWVEVGMISGLPATVADAKLAYQSTPIQMDQEYQYIRMYWTSGRNWTYFAELHFQKATLSPNCQNATLGEVANNLKKELKNAEALISEGKATQESIDNLQKAYDAYKAELADPTELKAFINDTKAYSEKVATPSVKKHESEELVGFEIGQPGVYSDENKAILIAAVAEAEKYIADNDEAGTYTKDAIKATYDKLAAALDAFKATAGQIQAANDTEDGIWYNIVYSARYFEISGTTPDASGEGEDQKIRKGKVYVDADLNTDALNNALLRVEGNSDLATLGIHEDNAKWRFINMGDTAYAIQNKATGLYIGENSNGVHSAPLSLTPVAFKLEDLGYATFAISGYRYDGETTSQLHIQTAGQLVVYWADKTLGGGSCFDIMPTTERADNVANLEVKSEEIVKGRLYAKCYPVALGIVYDEANTENVPYRIATIDLTKNELTLTRNENMIEAGMPFFYFTGDKLGLNDPQTAADTTMLVTQIDASSMKSFAKNPGSDNGLIGNYYNGTKLAANFGVIKEEDGVQTIAATTNNQAIGWNTAYIDAAQVVNAETPGEIVVPINGQLGTSIEDAIIDAQAGPVNVYSIDGVLIKKNVKVSNATKGLAKGIYIVGNKKVAVK